MARLRGVSGSAGRGILAAGLALGVGSLFLPWIAFDPSRPPAIVGSALAAVGALPDADPVAGYELPFLAREGSTHPVTRTSLALLELAGGRPDRAAARTLFGDRFEEDLAWFVFAPAALALAHLLLWRRTAGRPLAAILGAGDAAAAVYGLRIAAAIPQATGSLALEVRCGIPFTLLGLALLAVVSLATALPGAGAGR